MPHASYEYELATEFEQLSQNEQIDRIFNAAYEATSYTTDDHYTEAAFYELEAQATFSIEEFAQQMIAKRCKIYKNYTPNPQGLHAAHAEAQLSGTYHHLQHPAMSISLVRVEGVDTGGTPLVADRLDIANNMFDPSYRNPHLARINNWQGLEPRTIFRHYPRLTLVRLFTGLEAVITDLQQ